MNQSKIMTVLTDLKMITCIVQRGAGDAIVKAAADAGATGATVHFARGTGVREKLGILGVAVEPEKEVINIVVPAEKADEIFEVMYFAGKLNVPAMGFIYMSSLDKAATYIPKEVAEKIGKETE